MFAMKSRRRAGAGDAGRGRSPRPACREARSGPAGMEGLVAWRGRADVRLDAGVDLAGCPVQGADQEALVEGVFPDVLAVSHRGVEDPPLAVHPGPGLGEAGSVVDGVSGVL